MAKPATLVSPLLALMLLLSGTLLLSGCSALELVGSEPPRLFGLTPKSTFAEELPTVAARIDIEVPTATAGLNTARIALKPTPTRLEYYARARWIDVVPVMVQTLLLESFDNSEKIDVLGRGAYGLRADFALLTNIREFQAEYGGDGPPTVEVRLQVRMVRLPRRNTVGSTSAVGRVTAASTSLQDIVTAFDEAFGKATKRLVDWTIAEAAKAVES
jgi:cholesterol transport system auxiliary component